jgi:AcrR family transcriptional regulator
VPTALTEVSLEELRVRALHALGERAQVVGLRSVSMADLARYLGISSKTLYRCFETKDAMVYALIERWIEHLFGDVREHYGQSRGDALTALKQWGEAWVRGVQRFSPAFWSELERDHPDAYAAYIDAVRELRDEARASFAGDVRPGVPPEFAQAMFLSMVRTAADPIFSERYAMTRRDAVLAAIDLFALGAFDRNATSTTGQHEGGHQ